MLSIKINENAPARNPNNANQLIFFTYQKKSIFSSPIAATPAAEPMIKMLPPVPAQKAKNVHKELSIGYCSRLYMPCVAATSGTLSTMEDKIPIVITINR